ncbi:MCE family protein [Streptomyces sp. SID6673]|nr:MCE family protein [Streptomyces sp. SID11726]NEB24210.1 MCE family protein [Streptomyces sp. SID6673]
MFGRILHSRMLVAAIVVVLLVGAGLTAFRVRSAESATTSYCALLPDSIGLYDGSAVTVMGVPVGHITSVVPDGTRARVEFDVRADRRLPADVGATTLSQTLIADRRLALIGAEPGRDAPAWRPSECITKTTTPKSITETLAAMSSLADELNGADDPAQAHAMSGGVAALEKATAGTGDQINAIVMGLGRALDSPDAAIGHISDLLDALGDLSYSTAHGWGDIKRMLTRLPRTLVSVDQHLIGPSVEIIARLRDVLPMFNDITTIFGGTIIRHIESLQNLPQMISAGVGSLGQALQMIPVFTNAFENSVDPMTGRVSLGFTPPPHTLPSGVLAGLCTAMGQRDPDVCREPGGIGDLIPRLLGTAGTR